MFCCSCLLLLHVKINHPFFIFTACCCNNLKPVGKKHFPNLSTTNCHLLVAVSGGIDSVVLVHLLSQCGFAFSIAHCNFMLRAEESERDEVFVKTLAEHYGKPFFIKRFDTKNYANTNKLSTQEAARKLRFDWFSEIVNGQLLIVDSGASTNNFIVTAHHANDNIETLLINFFRGTGITGLHGILPRQTTLFIPYYLRSAKTLKTMQNKTVCIGWKIHLTQQITTRAICFGIACCRC